MEAEKTTTCEAMMLNTFQDNSGTIKAAKGVVSVYFLAQVCFLGWLSMFFSKTVKLSKFHKKKVTWFVKMMVVLLLVYLLLSLFDACTALAAISESRQTLEIKTFAQRLVIGNCGMIYQLL